ncbi:MAG: FKBP-type peptidyl-prolyl cis-trans isomerase [Gammaproteobacteria bacterium]|nr:FKBP-type peptidyl-prolyl cis-trans isomerase [Gammaproteobacteria bacterium]MDH3369809.1 FKBP-type peptidyl-prolyl cis-trans isomerase [Gammaproteobacteria bacterium]MDH3407054.1 FKBP-type peptidyl-prolyl cis-trans isomerase [Gammaproteobacteria bacterium]MDH3562963.1 FKBP-type peptidyl-prolyl cis-trans isomerase [Gammaproteobacteria bacterium]MDH5487162.1 FKBP-type peptidyl-prolyl cis-trans isomerase [Gammaproteobacteria bacterium]
MKSCIVFFLLTLPISLNAWGKDSTDLKTDKQKFSYSAGYQVGQNIKRQNLDLDSKSFSQGAQDAIANKPSKLKPEEMQAAIEAQQKKTMEKHEAMAKKNLEAGQAFLAANKKKPGVVTLPSGLQYKIITEGKGKQPKSTDSVVAHYRGMLINGTEFDSSYQRNEPATFPVGGVIKGWQEVLPLMKEGSKWQVFIPADLAYGPRGASAAVGPNEVLIFDIELLSVESNTNESRPKRKKPKREE